MTDSWFNHNFQPLSKIIQLGPPKWNLNHNHSPIFGPLSHVFAVVKPLKICLSNAAFLAGTRVCRWFPWSPRAGRREDVLGMLPPKSVGFRHQKIGIDPGIFTDLGPQISLESNQHDWNLATKNSPPWNETWLGKSASHIWQVSLWFREWTKESWVDVCS